MAWTRKLKSGKFQGQYRDPAGRVRSVGAFQRKGDARKVAEEAERAIRRGEWIDPDRSKLKFSSWADHYMVTTFNQRESTKARDESYLKNHLLPQFGAAPLRSIEPMHVRQWVARLTGQLAPATVVKCYQLFGRIMRTAEDAGYLLRSPCRGVTLPQVKRTEMRFLTVDELNRLASVVPDRVRGLVLTAGWLGLRWGEVAGLKRARLNLLQERLQVEEILIEVAGRLSFGEPKTAASRRALSLHASLVAELRDHLAHFSTHPELVFSGRDGAPLYRSSFRQRVWIPATEAAGLAPLRFHDLRHTAAGFLIASNTHPKVIQERLGHSSIQVTLDTYGHLLPDLGDRVADALESLHAAPAS